MSSLTPPTDYTDAIPGGRIPLLSFIVPPRLRRDTPEHRIRIEENLVPDIRSHGLIHPITLNHHPTPRSGLNLLGEPIESEYELIAGWSRSIAFHLLSREDIPYSYYNNLHEHEVRSRELSENIRRHAMSWQDICLGINQTVNLWLAQAPADEARRLEWARRQVGALLDYSMGHIEVNERIARHLLQNDKEIAAASGIREALSILVKRKEEEALAALHTKELATVSTRKLAKALHKAQLSAEPGTPPIKFLSPSTAPNHSSTTTEIPLYSRILNLDCFDFLASQPEESFDLCYTDPPFAIPMDSLEERADIDVVRESHDVAENLDQMERFFPALFRVMKPNTYSFIYYDMRHQEKLFGSEQKVAGKWRYVKGFCEKAGFKIQPYPIVWVKTHPCKNNASGVHFTKTFEYLLLLRKGTPTLNKAQLHGHKEASAAIDRKQQRNPFAKAWDFSRWLLSPVIQPGMKALDCYAGGGSLVRHMLTLGLDVYATEKDPDQFPYLIESIKTWHDNNTHGKVEFI